MSAKNNTLFHALMITGVFATLAAVGYAIYFDHRRRSDPRFRKHLARKKKEEKEKQERDKRKLHTLKLQRIAKFLQGKLEDGQLPQTVSEKETVFAKSIAEGEQLSTVPGMELESAVKFYKALAVYPNPTDLLSTYQRSIPEHIYENIVLMLAVMPPANISTFFNYAAAAKAESEAMKVVSEVDD